MDVRDRALALSAQLGADEVIDARKVDPVEKTMELIRGLAEHKTLLQAFDIVRDRGRVVQMAWHGVPVSIDVDNVRREGGESTM